MSFKNYREESKLEWGQEQNSNLTRDQITLGCMLRIADASELMAKRHADLVRNEEYWRKRAQRSEAILETTTRSRNALRGVVKRMKNANTLRKDGE